MKKTKKRIPLDGGGSFGQSPFAALAGVEVNPAPLSEGSMAGPGAKTSPVSQSTGELPRKVVLRKERKGRAGKTVTLVQGLEALDEEQVQRLAKRLRTAMGCGSTVDEATIVLQGDLGSRLERWFRDHEVPKVTRSG